MIQLMLESDCMTSKTKLLLFVAGLLGLWVVLTASFLQNRSFGTNGIKANSQDSSLIKDLPYGPDPMQKLDLCIPNNLSSGNSASLVILLHGGGGDKSDFLSVCKMLAERGIPAATANYREDPPPAYPRVVEDAKSALAYLTKLAQNRGITIQKTGAWGGSMGGYLSSMLGTNEFDNKVDCVSNNYGPTDFTDPAWEGYTEADEQFINKFFGGVTYEQDPQLYQEASAITYVSTNDAPSWLFTRSTNDHLVPRSQMIRMSDALRAIGIDTEIYEYTGVGPGHANKLPPLQARKLLNKRLDFMQNCLSQ